MMIKNGALALIKFFRDAYSDSSNPSSSRLHTGYTVYVFVTVLALGFYRVCNDLALKELIIPYTWVLAGLTAGCLGIQVARSIFGGKKEEEKPANEEIVIPQKVTE